MDEPKTIGLSDEAKGMLDNICGTLHFDKWTDAYKFAISVGLVLNQDPTQLPEVRGLTTAYATGSFDGDGSVAKAITLFIPPGYEGSIYKLGERLGEWGVRWLNSLIADKEVTVGDVLGEIDRKKGTS